MEICRKDDDIDKDGKDVWGREDSIHKDGSALRSQKNFVSVTALIKVNIYFEAGRKLSG